MNFVLNVNSLNFPRVSVFKPIIGNFNLVAIFDDLSENTIFISDSITPGGIIESGE